MPSDTSLANFVLAIVLFGYVYFIDGVRADEPYYTVSLRLPNAEGVHEGTPVKLAGVDVGDVQSVSVEGGRSEVAVGGGGRRWRSVAVGGGVVTPDPDRSRSARSVADFPPSRQQKLPTTDRD